MRRIYQGSFKDQNGNVVGGGTVTVYLAGASTLAIIYAAASGGSAISTSSVTSSSTAATLGYFYFYVDEADYSGSQLFDISLSKSGYTTNTYNNIAILFQPYDATLSTLAALSNVDGLTSIAGLTTAADKLIYTTASNTYAVTNYTASARSFDALNVTANKFAYGSGSGTYALADITAAGLAILDDANAAAQLVTLGALALAGGTLTGLFNQAAGANIASATTLDLTSATGNFPRITGTTATSAVTLNTAQLMFVVADGAWPLTYNATTNKLNTGGANYTCTAGDIIIYYKDLSGIVHGRILPTNGETITKTSASATLPIGYATGAGGTVTQATSKTTAVTLNKPCGQITMNNAALGAGVTVSFALNNSLSAFGDVIALSIVPGTIAASGSYLIWPDISSAGYIYINVKNNTAGSLSEALGINFALIKGVSA